jgi:hypothetical protein
MKRGASEKTLLPLSYACEAKKWIDGNEGQRKKGKE